MVASSLMSSLEDTPPLPNALGPGSPPALFFLRAVRAYFWRLDRIFCHCRRNHPHESLLRSRAPERPHHTSPRLRRRRIGGRSIESTARPSGSIHNPSTGRNPRMPPTTRPPPSRSLSSLDRGKCTRCPPSRRAWRTRPSVSGRPDWVVSSVSVTRSGLSAQQKSPRCENWYSQPGSDALETRPVFPGSSAVEQPAVNRLVAGSNPARGATPFFPHSPSSAHSCAMGLSVSR